MGLKDRLNAAKQYLKTPLQLHMLERGSDLRVHVGQPARVVVDVEGADDGTVERIELLLRRPDAGNPAGGYADILLGEVPTEPGRHELVVTIPPGTLPSAIGFGNYYFRAQLVRSKGLESDAVSPVTVVGRTEDLVWPEVRQGVEGPGGVRLDLALEASTADIGGVVAGLLTVVALTDLGPVAVEVEVGAEIDALVKPLTSNNRLERRRKYRTAAQQTLAPASALASGQQLHLPFRLEIPPGLPPTLRDGESSVVWQVRARRGDSSAWAVLGVVDPNSLSIPAPDRAQSLLDLLT
jgi:hypothetical protein